MDFRARCWSLVLVGSVLLGGCASTPSEQPSPLLRDAAFAQPTEPVDPRQALTLSPAMREFAAGDMARQIRAKGPRDGLIEALYAREWLQLEYDSERTRTAAEAFEARRGNCMSLVLMTAAFARHMGLNLRFNSVTLDESWTRANGMFFVAGHVNISVGRPSVPGETALFDSLGLLTIDFLPPRLLRGQRSYAIDEATLLAMFANNRAAEELTEGRLDQAYWWARAGVQTDPRWLASYNTLAVIYRRRGLLDAAEATLRAVLEREPQNLQAMSNLVLVLGDLGRPQQAAELARQLAQIQPVPPYAYFDQGVEAMRQGQYRSARELFSKEIARAAYVSEFHFWLALANYGLGDLGGARGEIAKALENSATHRERELYGAKLAWLNEQRRAALPPGGRLVRDTGP